MKIPGAEPVFRHLDDADVPWQQVRAVRRADGTVASPIELPEWLDDLRSRWVVDEPQ